MLLLVLFLDQGQEVDQGGTGHWVQNVEDWLKMTINNAAKLTG